MIPYLLMLAVPALLALSDVRRGRVTLLLVALFFWIMIGFRFQVGMDWDNYIHIYNGRHTQALADLILDREAGYGLLTWVAGKLGGGIILINLISALIFCWGLFAVAKRCREPFLALVVATPLLVVAFSMSATRQALACGIVFYVFATWNDRRTISRVLLVLLAASFHYSALFAMIFVALSSQTTAFVRLGTAAAIGALLFGILVFAPTSLEAYSRLYIGEQKISAPGAIAQVGVVALAGLALILSGRRWTSINGEHVLYRGLAWASLLLVPFIAVSSVGAYRLVMYLWPMAMYVWSGLPALATTGRGRLIVRVVVIYASALLLWGWLTYANNSIAWIPYHNWLLQPEGVVILRRPLH